MPRFESPNTSVPIVPRAVVWSLAVPSGYHTTGGTSLPHTSTTAVIWLRQAEAHLRLSELLIETAQMRGDELTGVTAADLVQVQRRFLTTLDRARQSLDSVPNQGAGPRGQPLPDWMRELRENNQRLLADNRVEVPPDYDKSEPLEPLSSDPPTEELLIWHADTMAPPRVQLRSDAEMETWRGVAVSGLLVTVLLMAWVLSFAPGMLNWARAFWPEQFVLLACLVWQTTGLTILVVLFAALGIGGRLLLLSLRTWSAMWNQTKIAYKKG
jgi:hypothetical protein